MSLSPQFLDELRSRTTLSTLIGKTIKVQKAGREYKACCPFHNEKTPSFTINDEKGFYHCFGCGAHGDAIRWMTDQRGLPFLDAIKELAAAAGMDVPTPDPRAAKRAEKAQSLHDVTSAAQDWFVAQLEGLEGGEARGYLARRGISDQTRRAFGFGFAPDSRGKLKDALKAFPEDMLVETGMLIQPEDEPGRKARESYDRFRGRLMIPIRDQRGRVIAFGGRILGAGEPKYLNSPETPLFDKGRTLYNLDKAAPAARKSGRIVVVEGYMDAVAISQAGIEEVVAPLGTALTEAQLEKLWSMVDTPTLCFDGDDAGQRAALRAAHRALPLLKPGYSLSFAILPPGQDPDDLIRERGVEAFSEILIAALPLSELLWLSEKAASPLDTPERRAGLKQRLEDVADKILNRSIKDQYRKLFRDKFWDNYGWRASDKREILENALSVVESSDNLPVHEKLQIVFIESILFGLMKFPEVIYHEREKISELVMPSINLKSLRDKIIDASYSENTIDCDLIENFIEDSSYEEMKKFKITRHLQFSFLKPESDREISVETLCNCIEALFTEQRAETELAARGVSRLFPFEIPRLAPATHESFESEHWETLRALQNVAREAHQKVRHFMEMVEAKVAAV